MEKKNLAIVLDAARGVWFNDCMTNQPHPNDLALIAKALKATNARNKRTVQTFRKGLATDKAQRTGIAHPGQFPTKYKYG